MVPTASLAAELGRELGHGLHHVHPPGDVDKEALGDAADPVVPRRRSAPSQEREREAWREGGQGQGGQDGEHAPGTALQGPGHLVLAGASPDAQLGQEGCASPAGQPWTRTGKPPSMPFTSASMLSQYSRPSAELILESGGLS